MNMWLTLVWRDFRLGWDQRKFNRKHTRAKLHQLWRPDVRLYNLAERTAGEGYREVNVVAFSNGTLQWIPPVVSRSLCPIDVFYFPFDVQLCALVYASGSYDAAQMQIYPRDTRPDMSEYLESGEWTLVDAFYRRRILESSMMNQSFAGVVVYLCLQRRALYYFVNVVTPCTCLNLLCLASFWAPCEETGKVGLTLATMLSYFLYVNNVSERLPRSYRIPILGIYLLGSMFLSVVAVIVAVVTVDLRSHGLQRSSCRARLRWLRAAGFINNVAFVASLALLFAGLLLLTYMACNTASFAQSMCSYYLEQGRGVEM